MAQARKSQLHASGWSQCSAERPAVDKEEATDKDLAIEFSRSRATATAMTQARKRTRAASAVQPGSSSAEPASKRGRTQCASEVPNDLQLWHRETISGQRGGAVVAFITCGADAQLFDSNCHCRALLQEVTHAIDSGAEIVNIAFSRTVKAHFANTDPILIALKALLDEKWTSSVEQPAYSYHYTDSVMSFFATSCGNLCAWQVLDSEGGLPCIMLTLDTPSGTLCCLTISLPRLPSRTRARLLDMYTESAKNSQADYILIGGTVDGSAIFAEHTVAGLKMNFEHFINEDLLVLACATDRETVTQLQCFTLGTEGPYTLLAMWTRAGAARSSAAQPAITLRPSTPLWNSVIEKMELSTTQTTSGEAFMKYVRDCCFGGDLLWKDCDGKLLEKPVPLAVKMEEMLRAAQEQRELQLKRLRTDIVPIRDMVMGPDDMKKIFNTWRKNVRSWMRSSSLEKYDGFVERGNNQAAHLLAKKIFNTHLFQLSGCKFLLHKFIELPIISLSSEGGVGEPARVLGIHLCDLVLAFEDHKKTRQYEEAVKRSRASHAHRQRLSREIWWAQWNYTQGRKLSIQKDAGVIEYSDLDADQQQLIEDFETRRSGAVLDNLLAQKKTPYKGAGAETTYPSSR